MADEQAPSAEEITPEMFREMVKGRSDEEILTSVKGNEEVLLDGIFDAMKAAFDPAAAVGQSAIAQYDLDTPGGLVSYQIKVDSGTCSVGKGAPGEARVTMAMSMPNFVRLMAGVLDATQAFMNGQLKISGDVMFAQNVGTWFKQPDG